MKIKTLLLKVSAFNPISFRDFLIIIGLSFVGYGLHLLANWIAFTVCGLLLLIAGLFMKEK